MCGRFTLKSPGRTKFEHLTRSEFSTLIPRYNIAPSQDVLAIIQQIDQLEAKLLHWGLIPSWSKEAKGFINARAETLQAKPSFSESFQRRRCLIPADGFYEWEKGTSSNPKQPYYFQLKDEEPFAFAGIWDEWQCDENTIASCAIITTRANGLLASIHDRMPVILRPEAHHAWLTGGSDSVQDLLIPFPATEMSSHPVSYDVNHPRIDDEHLIRPVEPNLGATMSLF